MKNKVKDKTYFSNSLEKAIKNPNPRQRPEVIGLTETHLEGTLDRQKKNHKESLVKTQTNHRTKRKGS